MGRVSLRGRRLAGGHVGLVSRRGQRLASGHVGRVSRRGWRLAGSWCDSRGLSPHAERLIFSEVPRCWQGPGAQNEHSGACPVQEGTKWTPRGPAGAGEMTQGLRPCIGFSEDLSLSPSTHARGRHLHSCEHTPMQTNEHIHIIKIKYITKNEICHQAMNGHITRT